MAEFVGQLELDLRSDLAEVDRLAAEIEAVGEAGGLAAKEIFNLNLALDEVVTNVISYAYPADRPGAIHVSVRVTQDKIQAEVRDEGRPFNPLEAPEPDVNAPLQERSIGGLGIFLVRRVMDEVEYRREGNSNVLTMVKKRGEP